MRQKKLIIIGAGDLAREIMYAAIEDVSNRIEGGWRPVFFLDKDGGKAGAKHENLDVISYGQAAEISKESEVFFICGIGAQEVRKGAVQELLAKVPQARFASIIHPSAVLMPQCVVDSGVYLAPHATVGIGCRIGPHVIVNFNVSMGHDCIVGKYSNVNPGCILSGHTELGENVFLGSGAITYPGVSLGDNCTVSAGAVVARNLKSGKKQILKPNTMILSE